MVDAREHEAGRDADSAAAPPASRSLEIEAARIRRQVRRITAEVNEKSGRNLLSAITIGLGLSVVMLAALLFDKRFFVPLAVALTLAVVLELTLAMRGANRRVPRIPSVLAAVVVVPSAYYFSPSVFWLVFLISLLVVAAWRLVTGMLAGEFRTGVPRGQRHHRITVDLSCAVFVHMYVTFLGSFTLMLLAQPNGQFWVISYMGVVVAVDTGAYVSGLRFGRTKLAPRISPAKTWEGLIGGLLLGMVAGIAACVWLLGLPWWFGFVLGVALTVTAVCGDLSESMIKRDLGVKDMSNWLPGHGGFFDRADSILPSGAMAFALYFWAAPLMDSASRLG